MHSSESPKTKILLVDDHEPNLVALSAILQNDTYDLLLARSGTEALNLLREHEFAVMLLDVMMPGMDGFEVARRMKQNDLTKHVPIIFVTAVAKDIGDIYRGYSVGAVDYLQKPLDSEVVKAKVGSLVDLFQMNQELKRQEAIIRNSERALYLEREQGARIRAEQAEQKFKNLVNSLNHAIIWEANTDLSTFSFVSDRAHPLLGFPPKEWLKVSNFFWSRIPDEDREIVRTMIERASKDVGENDLLGERCEHRFLAFDGTERWFHTGIQPERDINGRLIRIRGLSVDINPLKGVEHALRDSQERLDFALNAAQMGMWDWNLITGSLIWSDTHQKLWGFQKGEFKGTLEDAFQRVHPDDQAPLRDAIDRSLQNLEPLNAEFRVVWPTGEVHWIYAKGRAFHDSFQKPVRMSGVAIDITDRKRVEQEKESLLKELRLAVRAREEVVAVVAHDVKNPLSSILLNADLILREGATDPDRTLLQTDRIKRAAERIQGLAENVLSLAKVGSGSFPVRKKRIKTENLIVEANELLRASAEEKRVEIVFEVEPEAEEAFCDHNGIMQVLSNLMGNAIKFSPAGGQVKVQAKANEHRLVISIQDEGPGIHSEELPKIFGRFWQSEQNRQKGLGLGLYISQEIVSAHGGSIWVESAPGRGAVFYFALPQAAHSEKLSA